MVDVNFYRAFEEKHRGSRDLIKNRLKVYLPFILPLIGIYKNAKIIDLGCGRGEWLELVKSYGFDEQGIDLDDGMLAACRDLKLNVQNGDAVDFLKKLPDESQVVVSAFHVAEHMPFSSLQSLVQETLRVLKPGGLLILETPNPENIVVGTSSFYLDPTHKQPIPPDLLAFLPEYYGFNKVKIIRLQESIDLSITSNINLFNVFNGVSPDYAVIAQKTAIAEIIDSTADVFSLDYGSTLEALCFQYDNHMKILSSEIYAKVNLTHINVLNAQTMAQQVEAKAQQVEAKAKRLDAALQATYDSSSWRVTGLLSIFGNITGNFKTPKLIKSKIKTELRQFLQHTILYILQRPKVKDLILVTLGRFPAVKSRLMQVTKAESAVAINQLPTTELKNLTPRAIRIYTDLKAAIEYYKKLKS